MIKDIFEVCDSCGKADETVSERSCAFNIEVHDDYDYTHTVCDECEYEHAMDV